MVFIQLQEEEQDQVSLFMIIAFAFFYLLHFYNRFYLANWNMIIFLVPAGRGFGGPMQPGVFHGYPLTSPKLQGVPCKCNIVKGAFIAYDSF